MIQLKLAVCAESVVRDGETNTVSVFNILEEITALSFPAAIPKLSVLFMLERENDDPDRIDCLITFTLGEKELGRAEMEGNFEDKFRNRLMLVVQGVMLPEPGILSVNLTVDGKPMGGWQALVRVGDVPAEE
jgi:hypothetical protein